MPLLAPLTRSREHGGNCFRFLRSRTGRVVSRVEQAFLRVRLVLVRENNSCVRALRACRLCSYLCAFSSRAQVTLRSVPDCSRLEQWVAPLPHRETHIGRRRDEGTVGIVQSWQPLRNVWRGERAVGSIFQPLRRGYDDVFRMPNGERGIAGRRARQDGKRRSCSR